MMCETRFLYKQSIYKQIIKIKHSSYKRYVESSAELINASFQRLNISYERDPMMRDQFDRAHQLFYGVSFDVAIMAGYMICGWQCCSFSCRRYAQANLQLYNCLSTRIRLHSQHCKDTLQKHEISSLKRYISCFYWKIAR